MLKRVFQTALLSGWLLCIGSVPAIGQRIYADHSVLASGKWFKIAVTAEGVYQVDRAFLTALGVPSSDIPSASIRLFGNGNAVPQENNLAARPDDLIENAIEVHDGGDGLFNGNDYFLFYAPGPDSWQPDSASQLFRHRKNLVSDTLFYFLTFGGNGRRVGTDSALTQANTEVNAFNERYFHEKDLNSLLGSGKEWYGETFGLNNLSASFPVPVDGFDLQQPLWVRTRLVSRSTQGPGRFLVSLGGQLPVSLTIPAVSGNLLDDYALADTLLVSFTPPAGAPTLQIGYQSASFTAQGWLDWFELQGRKALVLPAEGRMGFRDWPSVGSGRVAHFTLAVADAGVSVWDITQPGVPLKMNLTYEGGRAGFVRDASRLHEYYAFTRQGLQRPLPAAVRHIPNQDLHNWQPAVFLIIAPAALMTQARELADFHSQYYHQPTLAVAAEQVYNEFGGGVASAAALRDFVKMYYDKSSGDSAGRLRYLLIFGGGSYDPKNRAHFTAACLPSFESDNSLSVLASYTSDDFFAFLGDSDDINNPAFTGTLAIAVGRLPVATGSEAQTMVDKIIRYHSKAALGPWRNSAVFVADDREANLFFDQTENLTARVGAADPLLQQVKLYADAFQRQGTPTAYTYPQVNQAILNRLHAGSLFLNFSGHGNDQQLSAANLFSMADAVRLDNADRLPLLIAATCDFDIYDDPSKSQLARYLMSGSQSGAIALLSSPRLMDAAGNAAINELFLSQACQSAASGSPLSLGEALQRAKNIQAAASADLVNSRKFTLIGDPAMQLAFPRLRLSILSIDSQPVPGQDTLTAGRIYRCWGQVADASGNLQKDFNGRVYPAVYAPARLVKTPGNDPASFVSSFQVRDNILFSGQDTVSGGLFHFSFQLPDLMSGLSGMGMISLYAEDGRRDAAGVDTSLVLDGKNLASDTSDEGPQIEIGLNNLPFKSGAAVPDGPLLIASLSDSAGINTADNGSGHNITVRIDDAGSTTLNAYYISDPGSFRHGSLQYQLPLLGQGLHSLWLEAWDLAGRRGTAKLDFRVEKTPGLGITRLFNYPNPFSGHTTFWVELNRPSGLFQASLYIYSLDGKLVSAWTQELAYGGPGTGLVDWNGRGSAGNYLSPGIYICRFIVTDAAGERAAASQKAVIIR